MRIITTTGYYATGSSAITDLLSEFSGCFPLTDYEFRFVQDPNGISDLEFNLVENHHRHNSGYSLKKYKKMVDFLAGNKFISKYEPFFDYQWKTISYRYIDSLTDIKFKGYWHQDVIDRGYFYYFRKRLINKIYQKIFSKHNKDHGYYEMPMEITYCSRPTENRFLQSTQEYIEELFRAANKDNKEDIMVDQIVPPSNVKRYIRYFKSIKIFIVDRDPRDLYIFEKYINKGAIVPVENVQIFCQWFLYTRLHRKTEVFPDNEVMFVQFENLVYEYENTIKQICKFLDYTPEQHIHKGQNFKPECSIRNTQKWKEFDTALVQKDIKYIEDTLTEYLFDFEKYTIKGDILCHS